MGIAKHRKRNKEKILEIFRSMSEKQREEFVDDIMFGLVDKLPCLDRDLISRVHIYNSRDNIDIIFTEIDNVLISASFLTTSSDRVIIERTTIIPKNIEVIINLLSSKLIDSAYYEPSITVGKLTKGSMYLLRKEAK